MKYEIYENGGDGLFLVVLSDDDHPQAIIQNWEYGKKGILLDAIRELAADPNAYKRWDGDLMEELLSDWEDDETEKVLAEYDYNDGVEPYREIQKRPTIESVYDEFTDAARDIEAQMVAWSTETGWERLPHQRMGGSAHDALGLDIDAEWEYGTDSHPLSI